MKLNDTTDLNGLFQDVDMDCSTNSSTYLSKDKTRNINIAYDQLMEFYYRKSKKIKPAQTDTSAPFNMLTYNLVGGTATVTIADVFRLDRAEVLGADGKYTELELITVNDIDSAVGSFETTAGTPRYMRIDGTLATLYPTPSASVTNGLILYVAETPTLFVSTDTTKEPLLPRFAHRLLSIGASLRYCNIFKQDRVPALVLEQQQLFDQLASYLETRDKQKMTLKAFRTPMK